LQPILRWPWPYKLIWSNYIITIGAAFIIAIVLARQKASKFLEHRIFTFFGDISYSFYLVHLPLLLTMASLFSYHNSFSMVYVFLSTLVLAIVISYLMFIFIEIPLRAFAVKLIKKYKVFNQVKT